MYEAIRNFQSQFLFEPKIEGGSLKVNDPAAIVVVGMGGSALAAEVVKDWNPSLPIVMHRDYGLPPLSEAVLKKSLIVLSSHSGNTEEVIAGFEAGLERGLQMVVISTGGRLLDLAKQNSIPYIQIFKNGLQPRAALGFSVKALLRALGDERGLQELTNLVSTLDAAEYEEAGQLLAEKLKDKIPVIYAATRNRSIAYNWKIKFNETGKIPAFYNLFPELNHNEMTGFDVKEVTKKLSDKFYFIFLEDHEDHPRIQKRMAVMRELFQARELTVEIIELKGATRFFKIFSSLLLADWASFYVADGYRLEAEQVPMVEEFKKLI